MFVDRTDAGKQLGEALLENRHRPVVVYALPRGGTVVAAAVASALQAPLDLIIVRKIAHPQQPEFAIGAIAEDGDMIVNPESPDDWQLSWFSQVAAAELKEARRRRARYLEGRQPVEVDGKTAVIVDDGIATGLTMLAAIHEIRRRRPARIVVAVPIAAAQSAARLASEVNGLVVLKISDSSAFAIGSFYQSFDQVTDEEVIALLKSASAASGG